MDSLGAELAGYHIWYPTRAELLREHGRTDEARAADAQALARATNPAERSLLRQRLAWT